MSLQMYQEQKPSGVGRIKNILAVAAGKGGVGKSTVAVQLALALKKKGYTVGLIDADIYGPSIRRMLPEDRLPFQKGNILYPALSAGIHTISMAYFRKENEAAAVRAPIANSLVTQFIKQVEWGDLDFLLIDFPPGTGDIQLTLSQQANLTGAVMVTTPQEVAAMDVRKAIHLFMQVKVPLVGIVENMSYYLHPGSQEPVYLFGKGGGERLASEYGVPFLGQIPIDPEISRCGDAGQSLFLSLKEESPLLTSLSAFADQVVGHSAVLKEGSKEALEKFELVWKDMPS